MLSRNISIEEILQEFSHIQWYLKQFIQEQKIDYAKLAHVMQMPEVCHKKDYIILALIRMKAITNLNVDRTEKKVGYELYYVEFKEEPIFYFPGKRICILNKKNALEFAEAFEKEKRKKVFLYKVFWKGGRLFRKKIDGQNNLQEAKNGNKKRKLRKSSTNNLLSCKLGCRGKESPIRQNLPFFICLSPIIIIPYFSFEKK